jgi:2,3-bisphosphoglycerate-independent phosphoglycerate mutase
VAGSLRLEKLVILILDGAADRVADSPTPLEAASTPGLNELARRAICGVHYPIAPGIAPESDTATLSLLGYNPAQYYTGRGPLEALGAGLTIKEGFEVAFRANFATLDVKTRTIIDRRVGRSLKSEEAKELAKALDGMRLLETGYAKVKATIGHRAVVILGDEKYELSDMVSNIDPAYVRKGYVSIAVKNSDMKLPKCKPLVDSEAARRTCMLVDEFVEKSIEILDNHPINIERSKQGLLKANVILLRDAGGKLPKLPPISSLYGFSPAAAIAEMPVEVGIAKAAGMKYYQVPPPSGNLNNDLPLRLESALKALKEGNKLIYIHLKGPDEPGHDGDFERKKDAIEKIDELFIQPFLDNISLEDTLVIVTSDHATPWKLRAHSGDPVPWLASWYGFSEGPGRFDEKTCMKGYTVEHGWQLIRFILDKARKQS